MSEVLQSLSNALAASVETVSASLVRVDARRRFGATGIVWSADGVIVTANHVVERDDNITVALPNGQIATATLVGRDPSTDLAVLRIQNAPTLTVPTWGEPGELKVGHIVLAIGRFEERSMATMGIVSALESGARLPAGMQIDTLLQTDVVMYPGFSGGPLVGVDGKIYGLNSSGLMRGVSMAIPVPTLRRVVTTLVTHGKVKRGYLGVGVQFVRLPEGLAKELSQETGLLAMSVEPNGPANGVLFMGDTVVGIAGKPVRDPEDLIGALSSDLIGKQTSVRIVRGGQTQEVQVTIGERG
jgi:S1-C subfamily serine protease